MKSLIFLIFVLSLLNLQAYQPPQSLFFPELTNSNSKNDYHKVLIKALIELKKQVKEQKELYNKLNEIRQIHPYIMLDRTKPFSAELEDIRSSQSGRPAQIVYFTLPLSLLALVNLSEIALDPLDDGIKLRGVKAKFLNWAKRSKVSILIFILMISSDQYIAYKGSEYNEADYEFLYEKYQDKIKELIEENKETLESLKDKKQFNQMIIKIFPNYTEELKRFDTFLEELKYSINVYDKAIEKLEKALKKNL